MEKQTSGGTINEEQAQHLPGEQQLTQQSQAQIEIPITLIRDLSCAGTAIGQGLITLLRWSVTAFVAVRASLNPENAVNVAILAIIAILFIMTNRRQ